MANRHVYVNSSALSHAPDERVPEEADNLKAACALHFAHYNFCRTHASLRVTPAMAAGLSNEIWPLSTLLAEV